MKNLLIMSLMSIFVLLSYDHVNSKPSDYSHWKIGDYFDDFGDDTGEHFAYSIVYGKFSNSATTNSKLKVKVIINADSTILIKLYEYARNHPVKTYRHRIYDIQYKWRNKIHKFSAPMYEGIPCIVIRHFKGRLKRYGNKLYRNYLYKTLRNKTGDIKIRIYEVDGLSTYSFTLSCNGLARILRKIK